MAEVQGFASTTESYVSVVLCALPLLALTGFAFSINSGPPVCTYQGSELDTAEAYGSSMAIVSIILGLYIDQVCVRHFGKTRSFFTPDTARDSIPSLVYQGCLGGLFRVVMSILSVTDGELCNVDWNDEYSTMWKGNVLLISFFVVAATLCMVRPLWIADFTKVAGKYLGYCFTLGGFFLCLKSAKARQANLAEGQAGDTPPTCDKCGQEKPPETSFYMECINPAAASSVVQNSVAVLSGLCTWVIMFLLAASVAVIINGHDYDLASEYGPFISLIFCGSYLADEFVDMATPFTMSLVEAWKKPNRVRALVAACILMLVGNIDRLVILSFPTPPPNLRAQETCQELGTFSTARKVRFEDNLSLIHI
eukprot:2960331-Rhodomonas_salina.1